MPSFVYPSLLAGLVLVGVPVLIHLINMMRHRRVPWAAMEFLLASQKKNRTWVLLKQLLLLLLRMAAIATVVLIAARPLARGQFGKWFGSARTHHLVLLDDSYSMSDRGGDTSVLDEAKAAIRQIANEAIRQVHPQQFTLLRFSRAGRLGRGTQPDLLQVAVDSGFGERLRDVLGRIAPSQTAAGPIEALEAAQQLGAQASDEQRIVYLVSDFRARQWQDPRELRRRLSRLNEQDVSLLLVNCATAPRANLTLTALVPYEGIRAAGVPLYMELAVQNHGPDRVRDVSVLLEEDGHARPAVRIAALAPGAVAKERFAVSFATAGQHLVTARLASDAVAADNTRYAVVDIPPDVPVLLIDADPQARDARFVAAALAPGRTVRTGITPRIETPRFLSAHPLGAFQAIYLLGVDRLDESAVKALESYVAHGGGLAVFAGPRSTARFINETLYRQGESLFPLPVAGPAELLADRLRQAPDVEVTDQPLFRLFAGQRNNLISYVRVERYLGAAKGWAPPPNSTVRVAARLRNGAPLVVEKSFGEGRVVAVLTTAAPDWNNWATGESFVIALHKIQIELGRRPASSRLVGTPLTLELDPAAYRPQVRLLTPQPAAAPMPSADATRQSNGKLSATFADTDWAGLYEAQLRRADGSPESRRFALNVDPDEGDLRTMTGPQLATRLEGLRYQYEQAADFHYSGRELAGIDLSPALLYALVVLLLLEQLLAWSASYHPPQRHRLIGQGGRQ
jgi:hypothetical protein